VQHAHTRRSGRAALAAAIPHSLPCNICSENMAVGFPSFGPVHPAGASTAGAPPLQQRFTLDEAGRVVAITGHERNGDFLWVDARGVQRITPLAHTRAFPHEAARMAAPPQAVGLPRPSSAAFTTGRFMALARSSGAQAGPHTRSFALALFQGIFVQVRRCAPHALESLQGLIRTDGYGQVLWSRRPAALLEREQYEILEQFQNAGLRVNDAYLLLKAPDTDEESLGYGGMLVNKANVRHLIQSDPAAFDHCPSMEGKRGADEILAHLSRQGCSAAMLEDHLALAQLLRYGKSNGEKFLIWSPLFGTGSPQQKAALQRALDRSVQAGQLRDILERLSSEDPATLHTVARLLGSTPAEHRLSAVWSHVADQPVVDIEKRLCGFPDFVGWDGPENLAICIAALQDALDIHFGRRPAAPAHPGDDHALPRAFLQDLFIAPPGQA